MGLWDCGAGRTVQLGEKKKNEKAKKKREEASCIRTHSRDTDGTYRRTEYVLAGPNAANLNLQLTPTLD